MNFLTRAIPLALADYIVTMRLCGAEPVTEIYQCRWHAERADKSLASRGVRRVKHWKAAAGHG